MEERRRVVFDEPSAASFRPREPELTLMSKFLMKLSGGRIKTKAQAQIVLGLLAAFIIIISIIILIHAAGGKTGVEYAPVKLR